MKGEKIEMPVRDHLVQYKNSPEISCPNCESAEVTSRRETETFIYGTDKDAAEISAVVQVYRCRSCGFEFTDEITEKAKHEAVCRHLGVLTPDEIAGIRAQYGLSRAEFARITKIGEASINRWENGQLIQGAAMDQYLRLLSVPENFQRVRMTRDATERPNSGSPEGLPSSFGFAALDVTEEVIARAREFTLH